MDYRGQSLCETLNVVINLAFGLLGFAIGYQRESFWYTLYSCTAGLIVSSIVCIPDWPFYNRAPLAWQPAVPVAGQKDPVTGLIAVPDTNELCGTCACGTAVHGIQCESYTGAKTEPEPTPSPSPSTVDEATSTDSLLIAAQ